LRDRSRVTIIHTVTQALLPNWVGGEQRREYKFQDGKIILRTPPLAIGGKRPTGTLAGEKIKLQPE
jgi:Lipocalin-like domain